jgi:hypothetical protein
MLDDEANSKTNIDMMYARPGILLQSLILHSRLQSSHHPQKEERPSTAELGSDTSLVNAKPWRAKRHTDVPA